MSTTKQDVISPSGTTYHADTEPAVMQFLDKAIRHGVRVRLFYGDTKTGRSWHEENDVAGQVGRSMGPSRKIPILLANSRSSGGGGILTHCIVAIATAGGNWAYRHPGFTVGEWAARAIPEDSELYAKGYRTAVAVDGIPHANFTGPTSLAKADRYIAFMTGKRLAK